MKKSKTIEMKNNSMSNLCKNKYLLAGLFFIINIILKAVFIGDESIWFDEANQIRMSLFSFSEIWDTHLHRANGPFYTYLLHFWIEIFGVSTFSTHFLSTLFVSLAVFIFYLFAESNFNPKTAVFGSIMLTCSNILTYFSHETRSYSVILFLTILSFFLFVNYIKNKKITTLLILTIVNTILLYTHLTLFLIIVVQALSIILYIRRIRLCFLVFCSHIISGLMIMIWVFANNWFGGRETKWAAKPKLSRIEYLYGKFLNDAEPWYIYALLALIVAILIFRFFIKRTHSKINYKYLIIVAFWAFIPVIALFLISVYYNPRFFPRYMIFTIPGMFIFGGYLISSIKINKIITICIYMLVAAPYLLYFNPNPSKPEEWKEAIDFYKKESIANSITFVSASYMFCPFGFYEDIEGFKKAETNKIREHFKQKDIHFINKLKDLPKDEKLSEFEEINLILAHYKVVDPEKKILKKLRNDFAIKEYDKFKGIEVFIFRKQDKADSCYNTSIDFENESFLDTNQVTQHDSAFSGNFVSFLDKDTKFSYTIKENGKMILYNNYKYITISAKIKVLNKGEDAKAILSINEKQNKNFKLYKAIEISDTTSKWQTISISEEIPGNIYKDDEVKFYFHNTGDAQILIDDIDFNYLYKVK